jgi:prefoldin subunit 5
MAPKEAPEPLRLESLTPQQLSELRQQLNNEIQRLADGSQQLVRAANTFGTTKKAVEQLGASKKGAEVDKHCAREA